MSQTMDQTLAIGVGHFNAGRLAEAEAVYRRVLADQPNNDVALDLLGQLAGRVNRHEAACDLFRQAMRLRPTNADYSLHLAQSLAVINQCQAAVGAYEHSRRVGNLLFLSGMGPLDPPKTVSGKLFSGTYALYSGLAVLIAAAVLLTPLFHRVLHQFHLDEGKEK